MHRIAATPGGWTPDTEGVILIEQTPAPIIILTAADTDIQTLAVAFANLPKSFPALRVVNLLQLQQELSIDHYAEMVLAHAQVIILRLLGGRSYWSYGLEVVKDIVAEQQIKFFVLPGDDQPDPTLMSHSTMSLTSVNQLWRYLTEGGVNNFVNGLKFVANTCLQTNYTLESPQVVPKIGLYQAISSQQDLKPEEKEEKNLIQYLENKQQVVNNNCSLNKVGILFYRSHYLAGNTKPIDALIKALVKRNLQVIPLFISSLQETALHSELLSYFQPINEPPISILINTTSFSLGKLDQQEAPQLWQQLNIPILQVILSRSSLEQWRNSWQGLTPSDVAMNIVLPEVDGRVITKAISVKSVESQNQTLETDIIVYEPILDRVDFVADLTQNWIKLQTTPKSERKIALILANYPNKNGRIANGVGLDTPASCFNILKALQEDGYTVKVLPENGDQLIRLLTQGVTNDPESKDHRPVYQSLSQQEFKDYFLSLPATVQTQINNRWSNYQTEADFAISGLTFGNIFVGIQPSRGYDLDPSLNYHAPDLEPTYEYLAYYYWLKNKFQALAVVHVGKHGNLEWLPGKSLALGANCYPEIALGSLPHFYPFIVNDPGEGSQAKRRSQAIIIDHLTPPLTRAELYDDLQQLESLIDEYYEAQSLDPSRLKVINQKILNLIKSSHLDQDLGLEIKEQQLLPEFITLADGYLCELKEAQIRNGLHIFGQCPQGEKLRDLILAIARQPHQDHLGLTHAIAADFSLNLNPLTANPQTPFIFHYNPGMMSSNLFYNLKNATYVSDVIEVLEDHALQLLDSLLPDHQISTTNYQFPLTQQVLQWIQSKLIPALRQTEQELTSLLKGLNGEYVLPGASGAPTRGRPDVLPTGRNFYSVDIRSIPTETAWDVGRKAAEAVIEKYAQTEGEYPKTLAISIWGTSTMRTGGDDVAQVLALLGVKPVWDGSSRRVIDFEILSPSALGRPRVDVTLRVSGFFRDSFPNVLHLLYNAILAVSSLKEEKEINPLAEKVQTEQLFWENQGLTKKQAKLRATHRIFGSKPGAYGAGLQGLIDSQNWQDDQDLATAYINWSSYAYMPTGKAGEIEGVSASESFKERLKHLQIVLHNQDNREHDLLDSDDYYQFQGGLTAAVRSIQGQNPTVYFGDNSIPSHPKVKLLKEEIAKVYRSRVVNPKWIKGVMDHGYKGAFEIAATVDYLFAYDATAQCVEDYMYEGVTKAYVLDEKVQEFIKTKNPWALRDLAERLLEANQRGLWQQADLNLLEKLRQIVHEAEEIIEEL
jgi:cobaltochelatase CobN